jgi:hypothetical protein
VKGSFAHGHRRLEAKVTKRITGGWIVVLLAAYAAAQAGASTGSTRAITLHLVEKQFGFNYIDNPPRQGRNQPPLMGDEFVFSSELQTRSGQHVGWLDATCIITRGGVHGHGPCYGVFSLKGGQLVGMAAFSESNVTNIAVTGGTGAYAGATGTVRSVSRGDNSPFTDDTFSLQLPA